MIKDGRQAERSSEGVGRRTLLNGACVGGVAVAASMLSTEAHADEKGTPELPAGQPYRIILDFANIGSSVEFSALTEFSTKIEIEQTLEVSVGGVIHSKALGNPEPVRIGLRRGFAGSDAIWAWHEQGRAGLSVSRLDTTLRFVDADGAAVAKYHLQNSVPAAIDLDVTQTLMETVLIVASDMKLAGLNG